MKKGKDSKSIIDQLFTMIDDTVADREENIRTPINRMLEEWKTFIEGLKSHLKTKIEKVKLSNIDEI